VGLRRSVRRARYRALSAVEDVRDARIARPAAADADEPRLRLLFVCLGNTCRSPLAEGILRSLLAARDVADVEVASAGTSGFTDGLPADPRARRVAREHGVDLREHRARGFRAEDFERFDRIVVFDRGNLETVLGQARSDEDRAKVSLLLGEGEVADPVAGDRDAFDRTYDEIAAACERLVAELDPKL